MNFPDIETRTWVEKSDTLKSVIFSRSFDGSGRVEKEFIIHSKHYAVDVQIRFTGLSPNTTGTAYDIVWSSGINPTENDTKNDLSFCEAFALQGGEQLKTKGNSTGLREGETSWVAIRNKYFLMALVPRKPLGSAAELQGEKITFQFDGKPVDWRSFEGRLTMPVRAGETSSDQITLYIGPMDYLSLKGLDAQLEKMMNFGSLIIRPFSIAFFYTLQFLYNIIKNYGWTIIFFAIIIKIVLHPLTRKSYQSMRKMKELQPDINKLKEQFKNNPQKLNQATMNLYKDKGINPMGGG